MTRDVVYILSHVGIPYRVHDSGITVTNFYVIKLEYNVFYTFDFYNLLDSLLSLYKYQK